MKKLLLLIAISFTSLVFAQKLQSPNGKFVMNFSVQSGGYPSYQLNYKGKEIVKKNIPEENAVNELLKLISENPL